MQNSHTHTLAIDQGTHASRCLLFDQMGRTVKSCWRNIELQCIDNKHIEQDASQLLASVTDSLTELLQSTDNTLRKSITACGISTQRSTVVICDSQGNAIHPALSWQDTRASNHLDSLKQQHAEIQSISGLPVSAHYGASKLRWLYKHTAAQKTGAFKLAPLVSYLLLHLLENQIYSVDHSNAQRTQLMNLSRLDWSEKLCSLFEVPDSCLPAIRPIVSHYGYLTSNRIPVTAVCGDQNAAVFGAGFIPDTETAIINIGSGAFILRMLAKLSRSQKQLTGIGYSTDKTVRYVREGTVNGAGTALSWFEQQFDVENLYTRLPDWLQSIKDPPLFINTIGGLGSPWWQSDLQARFVPEQDNDIPAKAVAVIESILFLLMDNFILMKREQMLRQILISGGLSRLDGLCQKLANLSGLTVQRFDNPEATARGSAWLAAGQPEHWALQPQQSFEPQTDSALQQRYQIFSTELATTL
ncbi:MAG: FGGY family carbohydrate kinase [Gammaproteobacteria bacterium]